jgi:hypothetical protein
MRDGRVQLATAIRLLDGASCGSVLLDAYMLNSVLFAADEASATAWVHARMPKAAGTLLGVL